jgi:acyl-CoA dehydrogenase
VLTYIVNGSKTFITNGYLAGLVLLVVKTDATLGAKGTSILIVETQEPAGYRRGPRPGQIGQRAQDTSELFFLKTCGCRSTAFLGPTEGKGFACS